MPVQCTSNEKVAGFLRDISMTERPVFLVRHQREAIASRLEVSPKIPTGAISTFATVPASDGPVGPICRFPFIGQKQTRRERLSSSQFGPHSDIETATIAGRLTGFPARFRLCCCFPSESHQRERQPHTPFRLPPHQRPARNKPEP